MFVVVAGETRIGHIYKDDFTERQLKEGDVYSIRAGSAFYLVNPAEGQRLHIICSISTSNSLGLYGFQVAFLQFLGKIGSLMKVVLY